MAASKLYDVLVIGGGPAGLALAGGLARQLHTALVIDSGEYRNARAEHMHNVPGFDHVPPSEFRAKVKADLERRYETVEFASATVRSVARKQGDGEEYSFEATSDDGRVFMGKKLALGTGVRDVLEDEVEGYAECWGRGVFHCLFCHGFEERGADSVGVLAGGFVTTAEMVAHVARMAKRLSSHVTIYTNSHASIATALPSLIHSSKISIDTRPIKSLSMADPGKKKSTSVRVTFADDDESTAKTEGFIVSHPKVEQRAAEIVGAEQLGLEMTPSGEIKVSPPFNETSVPGCFAAGDAATMMRSVSQAVQMGGFAAAGLVAKLQYELDLKDEL